MTHEQLTRDLQQQLLGNPYETYARLRRERSPVKASTIHTHHHDSSDLWLLSTYSQAERILNNKTHFSKDASRFADIVSASGFDDSMLFKDEPEHLRLRGFIEDLFRKHAVDQFSEIAKENANSMLAALSGHEVVDVVDKYAEPLPLLVIATLLGIPEDYMPVLRNLSRAITNGSDSLTTNTDALLAKREAYQHLEELLAEGIQGSWHVPADSLLSRIQLLHGSSSLSTKQAISMLLLLLFAGHETTIALISSALYLLFSHPDQLERLQADPKLIGSAIEEVLRYETPLQRSTFRVVTSDLLIDDHLFRPGDQVSVILGSANRDESIFPYANTFRVDRFPNPHLAFGRGSYHCIGRHLSVLEARISVAAFIRHFPHSSLASEPRWQPNTFIRSLDVLPMRLAAASHHSDPAGST